MFEPYVARPETLKLLALFEFKDDAGQIVDWTNGQIEIIDCILHRSSKDAKKRIQIICATRYGKSLAVAAGVLIRAVLKPEKWAIIAGTKDKAQIIMDYVIMFAVNSPLIRVELDINEPIDRLRQSRRRDRLTFRGRGEIRVFSANSSRKSEVSKALMGFGCIPSGYKVLTDRGDVEISELVKSKSASRVYSYNHKSNKVELQDIVEYQDNPLGGRQLFSIDLGDRKFTCTEDHPVWICGKGYVAAKDVKIGDTVYIYGFRYAKLYTCKSIVKYAQKSFTSVLAMLRESVISFVAERAEGFHTEAWETRCGNNQKLAYSARQISRARDGQASFVAESAWGFSLGIKNITGKLKEVSAGTGRAIRYHINHFTDGLLGVLENQQSANIAERLRCGLGSFIGRIKAESIKEIGTTGSGCAHSVTKSTIIGIQRVKSKSDRVYNLTVKNNENYFIEGTLLHNSPNIIEDEAALVPDPLQATVMRMLADAKDNFLVKIGNPFTRGHFLRTWRTKNYYKVFIDYVRGIAEGRYTQEFIDEMKQEDPMLFDINFGCLFPDPSAIDESGWMHLFTEDELSRAMKRELQESGTRRLGVDVARGGRDSCALVLRTNNYAKVIKKWKDDDNWSVAEIVKNAMFELGVSGDNVYVDDNGVGGGVTDVLKHWKINVVPVNFGDSAEDKENMLNCRSECFAGTDGLYNFIKRGAKLEQSDDWYEAAEIRYKKDFNGKIKMESKDDMRRRGIRSPDVIDALALTFAKTATERYYRVDPAIINSSGVKPYFEGMPG